MVEKEIGENILSHQYDHSFQTRSTRQFVFSIRINQSVNPVFR